ncbi:MAG: hypothetical protein ACR2JJ_05635 [Sphingomicrobium sp.]
MLRFLLLLATGLALGTLFALANAMRRPLARLTRVVLRGLVAVLVTGGLAIGITGLITEAWWAAILGGGLLVVALRLAWALRRPRLSKPVDEVEPVPLTSPEAGSHWRFDTALDWMARKQARRSRRAIEGFVAERDSPSLTHEHRSLLLSCEKRVPELIDTCLDRCRNASLQERERYIDETLDRLVQIGGEAERARREVRKADDQRLQVLHRYFDGMVGDSDQRPGGR